MRLRPANTRRRGFGRRLQILLALAAVAAALSAVTASGASFVSDSSTTVMASTSALGADRMSIVEGTSGRDAVAGTAVDPAPSVYIEDGSENPVSGLTVTFTVVSGGGSFSGSTSVTAVTDEDGTATAADWTLGLTPGANTVRARCDGVTGSPLTFTATGTSGHAVRIVLNAGDAQSVAVGTTVPIVPSVKVTDAGGNPVKDVAVAFAVASGGGSITKTSATTDASGIANCGSWRLGTTAGLNTLTATSAGLTGSPVSFSAAGVPGAPTRMTLNAGDGQTVHVGTPVAIPPSVLVRDAYNNAVPGATVTFAVASGGGSITGANATTDASGIAAVGSWTLGTVAGPNTLTATKAGLTGSPVTFTASGLTGSPTTIMMIAGNGQSATVNAAVAIAPRVRVRDSYGNGVSGVAISFAGITGGGSITGASATTDPNGYAAVGSWTLGTAAGTNTLTATSPGLTGSPITFTATGTAGIATKYVVSSSNYSPPISSAVTVTAQLADQYGNPVATLGVPVTFTKTPNNSGSLSNASASTDSAGVATVTLAVSQTVGVVYTVTATSSATQPTRTGTTPPITSIAGTPTKIALNAGNNQSATVNTAVATAPRVLVTDAYNNPVSGVAVAFAVASGDGSVTGGSATTNAAGIATVGSWTLGTTAGANTLTATCAGLGGSPVIFTAAGLAGPATKYVVTSSNYSPVAGAAVTITAQLADQYGNAVATSGIRVTFSKTGNGGKFSSTRVNTNSSGIATTTFTTSTTSGRTYTFTARSTSGGTRTGTSPVVKTVSGAPTQIARYAGNGQTATAGTGVATVPSVRVRDSHNNVVPGVVVTFAVTAGGGSITTASATTDASGIATCGAWTLGTSAGANTLTATRAGLTGSPVTFTATGVAGAATKYVVTSSIYDPIAGRTVSIAAQLVDQYDNPVATRWIAVTFTKNGPGGSFGGPNPATTDSSGVATITFTTGTPAGTTYTVTATSAGAVTGISPPITTH